MSLHHIRVLGKDLQLRSTAPDEEVKAVEAFVNARVTELQSRIRGGDPLISAILALMNLAGEHLRLTRDHERRTVRENERAERLLSTLESVIETTSGAPCK